jgi:hypothetical protein
MPLNDYQNADYAELCDKLLSNRRVDGIMKCFLPGGLRTVVKPRIDAAARLSRRLSLSYHYSSLGLTSTPGVGEHLRRFCLKSNQ